METRIDVTTIEVSAKNASIRITFQTPCEDIDLLEKHVKDLKEYLKKYD